MERARILITGMVQGVFFRATARSTANKLGIFGWVRNNHDGSVESVVEGDKDKIEEYIQWCHKGSYSARVEKVAVNWEKYEGEFESFRII